MANDPILDCNQKCPVCKGDMRHIKTVVYGTFQIYEFLCETTGCRVQEYNVQIYCDTGNHEVWLSDSIDKLGGTPSPKNQGKKVGTV